MRGTKVPRCRFPETPPPATQISETDNRRRARRGTSLPALVDIMERLFADDGCPWDREQTLLTLRPFLIEEAHEVLEAIDANDAAGHCEELGDLLFQIVFQAALRAREGAFGIDDVVASIAHKMTFRHPHVFGDAKVKDSAEVLEQWDVLKAKEKAGQRPRQEAKGALDGVPLALPAPAARPAHRREGGEGRLRLARCARGHGQGPGRAARDRGSREIRRPSARAGRAASAATSCSQLRGSRAKLGVAPEDALREATSRFAGRFQLRAGREPSSRVADGRPVESNLDEMDRIWNEVKARRGRARKTGRGCRSKNRQVPLDRQVSRDVAPA